MATQVAIYNLALTRCGVTQPVTALDESSTGAQQCAAVYEICRDEVLRAFPWEFAAARAALSLIEEDPNDDWYYSYAWPSDCITPRMIPGGERGTSQAFVRSYTPEVTVDEVTTPAVRHILTDVEDAELIYTARVTDPTLYDSDFVSALAWRMAMDVSIGMSRAPNFYQTAERNYFASISKAKANAANETQRDAPPESDFITERL
jgi:hypothetical protein